MTILPIWAKPGNTIIRKWSEPFNSGDAAHGIAHFVEFADKKGELQTTMMYIVWIKQYAGEKYD